MRAGQGVKGSLGVDTGRKPTKRGVRPLGGVVDPPGLDQAACFVQRREQVLVQALIAEPTVEALHEGVLVKLSQCDVVPFHVALLLPVQKRVTGQFGAVVANDHTGLSSLLDQTIKLTGHAHAWQRGVDHDGQGLPPEVFDHAPCSEAPPV